MDNKKDKKQGQKAQEKKINTKISSLDIDKNEFREIVLSNSNNPERDFYR